MPKLVSKDGTLELLIGLSEDTPCLSIGGKDKPFLRIGTDSRNDLVLNGEGCSDFHAAVYRDASNPTRLYLLNYSPEGTLVDGHPVAGNALDYFCNAHYFRVFGMPEDQAEVVDLMLKVLRYALECFSLASVRLCDGDQIGFGRPAPGIQFTYRQ